MCFYICFPREGKTLFFVLHSQSNNINFEVSEEKKTLVIFKNKIYDINEFGTMFLGLFSFFLVNFAP